MSQRFLQRGRPDSEGLRRDSDAPPSSAHIAMRKPSPGVPRTESVSTRTFVNARSMQPSPGREVAGRIRSPATDRAVAVGSQRALAIAQGVAGRSHNACLEEIRRLNPILNAFITVTGEQALADARVAETEIARGKRRGRLHGIPIALKDLFDTAGVRTTAGSAIFANRVPTEDAEVVRRLKASGAILVGKLNMHEFAYGDSSAQSHFGPVRNPWNRDYVPGGSSGGSAAAVAARLCYGALGSDTGGSIRQPAAYCGIVGLSQRMGLSALAASCRCHGRSTT